jgi:hypothetical protein
MSRSNRFERLLRWYPTAWRSRYGAGMVVLMEDTYATAGVPLRSRLAIMRAGVCERAREAGVLGRETSPLDRQRAGSLLVLCGWAAVMLAGAFFAKFTDNWNSLLSGGGRTLSNVSFIAVQWGGVLGIVLVAVAVVCVVPSLVALVRAGGWASVRRPIVRTVIVGAVVVALTVALVAWAHHLPYRDRNGGLIPYEFVVAGWSVTVAIAVGVATSAAVSVTRRLELSARKIQSLSLIAVTLTFFMFVIFAGTLAWAVTESLDAPAFMRQAIGSGLFTNASSFPPVMVVTVLVMLLGLAAAITGTVRVAQARHDGALRYVGDQSP